MTQHCTITGTMLVPVHYIVCTLKIVFFPEITVFVVVKINSFQCQCQCQLIFFQIDVQQYVTLCYIIVFSERKWGCPDG